jgi:transposase InsO family protein
MAASWNSSASHRRINSSTFTTPPKYLLRDRDGIYGLEFQNRAQAFGLEEVRIAPRSPWQSPYIERFIGSFRRECLDHVIVFNQAHLHRLLESYFSYYHRCRSFFWPASARKGPLTAMTACG